jgi:tetratricopeptide (TPR) repeat protein
MSGVVRTALLRATLLGAFAATAACTSLGVAPTRPSPAPEPAPPVSSPLPGPTTVPQPPPSSPSIPEPERDVAPSRPQSDATAASGVLLQQSRAQRAAGSLPAARATLERALRLDPNNPEVWIELGELELQTGNLTQATAMARKALTLTGRDSRLASRAERLLRAAE